MNKIKVVSWNVNSIRARIELFVNWIKISNPDIILLQETHCDSQTQAGTWLAEWKQQGGTNGWWDGGGLLTWLKMTLPVVDA